MTKSVVYSLFALHCCRPLYTLPAWPRRAFSLSFFSTTNGKDATNNDLHLLHDELHLLQPKPKHLKIVIGGRGESFSGAFEFTKAAFSKNVNLKHAVVVKADDKSLKDEIGDATVVIPFMLKIDEEVLSLAPDLKLVMQYGVGLEGVDIVEAKQRGILVGKIASNESANARSCAEHSVFLALACFRKFNQLRESLQSHVIGYPTGRTLCGSTAAIYGFGGIGRELSPLLKAMGMKVIVLSKSSSGMTQVEKQDLQDSFKFDEVIPTSDWKTVADRVDVVFLCCTLNASSKNLVNREFLSVAKAGLTVVNVSRGGLLDYPAVQEAIDSGRIGALGLDVYHTEPFPLPSEDRLLGHPRVVATPHVAGVTETSHGQMAGIIADNVERLVLGLPLQGLV